MKSFKKFITESEKSPRITLWMNPEYLGATPHTDNFDDLPTEKIPIHLIQGIEPEDKMNDKSSNIKMNSIANSLSKGENVPPILLRKHGEGYQVLDGHHRFYAHKLIGSSHISSKIVPEEDIHIRHDTPQS